MCVYISAGNPTLTEETRRIFELTSFSKAKALTNVAIKIQPRAYGRFLAREPIRYLAERQREREASRGTPMVWTCGSRSIVHLPWKFSISAGILWNVRKRSKFRKGSFNESMIFPVKLLSMPLNLFNSRLYNILANFSNCVDFVIK